MSDKDLCALFDTTLEEVEEMVQEFEQGDGGKGGHLALSLHPQGLRPRARRPRLRRNRHRKPAARAAKRTHSLNSATLNDSRQSHRPHWPAASEQSP